MTTTTKNIETTEFDDNSDLKNLYILLKRIRDSHSDTVQCHSLHELSKMAETLAKKYESHS